MNKYIGIDLGTSSVKLLLTDSKGNILNVVSKEYDVMYPNPGWTEQDPRLWWLRTKEGIKELIKDIDGSTVKGISFGGQMHGLVILDESDNVIRPCILWNDGRTNKETEYLNEVIGKENLSKYTGNIAFAGFTAPKILWVKNNEPENFNRIKKIMLPKDYIQYLLTGTFATDYSDASGMLLLDCKNKCYSKEMLDICFINESMLPKLYESYEVTGRVKSEIAQELGLSTVCIVTAGAGDNAAAAIGMGTIEDGYCNISLGTSGTIFVSSDKFSVDSKNALHSFAHANSKWHLMGCILSAASDRSWWLEDILDTKDYVQDEIDASNSFNENLFFLPYLSGERSPHNDVNAKGAFIGLTHTTTKGEMSRAIMEGVAFALRDCLEVAKSNGVEIKKTTICGGGARSKLWWQIITDTLNLEIELRENVQGPSFGGAILAMIGANEYPTLKDCLDTVSEKGTVSKINPEMAELYERKYQKFRKLYPILKDFYNE